VCAGSAVTSITATAWLSTCRVVPSSFTTVRGAGRTLSFSPAAARTITGRPPAGVATRVSLAHALEAPIVLPPAVEIVGTVTALDDRGRPGAVPGAVVRVTLGVDGAVDPLVVERSDDAGGYAVGGLPIGVHTVSVHATGLAAWSRRVEVSAVDTVLDIELGAAAAVDGVVLDTYGAPIDGAVVTVRSRGGVRRTARASADGTFFVEVDRPGPVDLLARAPGYAPRSLRTDAPSRDPVEIELASAWLAEGTVVAAGSGLPIEGASLEARPVGPDAAGVLPVRGESDVEGIFILALDPRCDWELIAEATGYRPEHERLSLERTAHITLRPSGEITVRCIDEGGDPVENAVARLVTADGSTRGTGTTNAAGLVRFRSVPAEVTDLRVTHDRMLGTTVPVRAGRAEHTVTCRLVSGGAVRGTLVHDAEQPGDLTLSDGTRTLQTWPDEEGAFEFAGLTGGTYVLRYRPRLDAPVLEQTLVVHEGLAVGTTVDARGM